MFALLGCLTFLLSGCSRSPLDADEVAELFADKTIQGTHKVHGFVCNSYYDPGGVFLSIRDGKQPALIGRWRVLEDGKIYIRWEDATEELCRNIVRSWSGKYTKVLIKGTGRRVTIVRYQAFARGKSPEFQ